MKPTTWPCGTPKSTGNAFDLSGRKHSIFFDPRHPPPVAPKPKHKQMPMQVSTVKSIAGLSKQAQAQLAKAPKSIGIDRLSDGFRRSKNKKAAI